MKFKYNLDTLLRHRKIEEDLAQRDFSSALQVLNQEEQKLQDMFDAIQKTRNQRLDFVQDKDHGTESLKHAEVFIKGTEIRIERQKKVVEEKQKIVEEKREILRQAAVEYKIIDKHKENKRIEFSQEMKKKEQKNIDELVTMRHKKGYV